MKEKSNKKNMHSGMGSKLLCYLLSGALLAGSLVGFLPVSVSAAETIESSEEKSETLQPKVTASNYTELAQAIDEAENGDIIGIDNIIELDSNVNMLGNSKKRITICRMSENSYIAVNLSADVKVENIIFDGRGLAFDRCYVPMFQVEGKANFYNVTFQNCYNNWSGGAIIANGGEMDISGCHFTSNRASEGGHIIVQSAKINVQNSVFENGVAENEGGAVKVELIYGYENGIEFDKCIITGNQAQFGGAVASCGDVKITNSVVYGNQAKSAAEFINYMDSSFQIDSIEEVTELYKGVGIVPIEWIYDYDNKSYISGSIDKNNPNAALKLVYEKIPDEAGENGTEDASGNNNSQNDGSGKDESKSDTTETEQSKEDNNGDNSAVDNKENTDDIKNENSTGDDTTLNNGNTGNSNSEQNKSEEGTAADSDSEKGNDNKGNDSTENNENQENQEDKQENQGKVEENQNSGGSSSDSDKNGAENSNNNTSDTSTGNGNQTGISNTQKPENNKPDNAVNNGNQGGASDGNMDNESNSNNQNQPNKPVSGAENNVVNNNPSGDASSGSVSGMENGNINDSTSQNGENTSFKPEDSKDSDSSNNEGTAAITDNSPTVASDTNNDSSDKETTVTKKKSIKKLTITAKKGKKKVLGKTIKKATVKVRIGKKIYKIKSNAKGKFTIRLKGKTKLKKGQKIKVTVSKKGYKSKSKIFKVK